MNHTAATTTKTERHKFSCNQKAKALTDQHPRGSTEANHIRKAALGQQLQHDVGHPHQHEREPEHAHAVHRAVRVLARGAADGDAHHGTDGRDHQAAGLPHAAREVPDERAYAGAPRG